jgi:hypothetical protein
MGGEMIKPEDREMIAARLLDGIHPMQELMLFQVAETVEKVREHDHPEHEDWACMNWVAWMGERMGFVLKRLLDEAAEADELRQKLTQQDVELGKLYALEAAGVDNWGGYDYAMEIMREGRD